MSGFYVIVTGYDQQVKCQLLNAMAGQKDKFQQFSCRRSPIVKTVKYLTIGGNAINLVQTPSLGAPGWKKVVTDFRESPHWTKCKRIFFYAKTEPSNVDDKVSIEDLQKSFGTNLVRIVVCICQKSEESSGSLENDDPVQYRFNLGSSFEMQRARAKTLLERLDQKKMHSPKASQVGADISFSKTVPKQSSAERQESIDIASTVNVADPEGGPDDMPPEKKKISPEDWELFERTLRHGAARSNHLRVNVVGNHGVGKTTLIKRLLQQEVRCPDPEHVSTENLEVHHLVARCVERNGEKVWEHDISDTFLDDLNIQRMAQAMIETEKYQTPTLTTNDIQRLEMGSDFIEDSSMETEQQTDAQSTTPYENLTTLKEKGDYLIKVLYCKEQLQNENHEKQYVSYWDFAGQATYYATHQLFMSPSAVYLVVIDLRKELDDEVTDNLEFRSGILQSCTVKEALKYWIHTVQAYTKDENDANAPIIVVGTHKGDVDNDKYLRKFNDIREMFEVNFECVAIENSIELQNDEDIRILRSKIIDNGLGVIDKKVSTQWINLEYDMQLHCDKNRELYLKFSDVQRLDQKMDLPMHNVGRIEAFLYHQHYKGKLLYYNHQDLKDLVITDPMLLVKYLNLLLRRTEKGTVSTHGWNENGILNQSYLQSIADKIEADKYTSMIMVKILVKLNILHPLPSQIEGMSTDKYFLPCLLPDVPKNFHCEDDECTQSSLFQIRFDVGSIFQTTYHQIICALLKTVPLIEEKKKKLIYNLGAHFDLEGNAFRWLTFYWQESGIYFYVKDFDKGADGPMNQYVDEVMELLVNAIEEVLTTNQHGNVEYDFCVECPKHAGCFLCLDDLKENDKAMCHGTKPDGTRKRHKVTTSDISSITQSQTETKEESPAMKEKPSDSILARLAWKLKMLNGTPRNLAVLLKMQEAFIKADMATRDSNEPGTDLISILISWRNQLKHNTTSKLLNLLCKRNCFDRSALEQAMFKPVKTDTRLDSIPDDATSGNKDIVIISDHLCDGSTFVLIELGVKMEEVAQERRNHLDDTKAMIRELLHRWRSRKTSQATTRAVLEAMRMLELPLDPIITKLNSLTSR